MRKVQLLLLWEMQLLLCEKGAAPVWEMQLLLCEKGAAPALMGDATPAV